MSIGIGGSTVEKELMRLEDMTNSIVPINKSEYQERIKKAQSIMCEKGISAIYLNAGTNLYYFTGTRWHASERMVGAILTEDGGLAYIAPHFEIDTIKGFMQIQGNVYGWHEHECPYKLFGIVLEKLGIDTTADTTIQKVIAIDESTSFFLYDGIAQANSEYRYINAKTVSSECRMYKSSAEIALLQCAKNMTLEVQKSAARILYEGISTSEVTDFIDQAHRAVGAKKGSYFCIVLFGPDSAYPHGVKNPKQLDKNDMVLIDTGCQVEAYNSDITRSYVFGKASEQQRKVWNIEKSSQAAAFVAAQLGVACGKVDDAAREHLVNHGFGPGYDTPGLPHRTGHGIGLDIHEWPYLVSNDKTPLGVGMCFSNEPMLCIPGEFGVRLEDHFYMTESGPKWFTEPSHSIDDPFA